MQSVWVHPKSDDTIYARAKGPGDADTLHASSDGGSTFVGVPLPASAGARTFEFSPHVFGDIAAIVTTVDGTRQLHVTKDMGAMWLPRPLPADATQIGGVAFDAAGTLFLLSHDSSSRIRLGAAAERRAMGLRLYLPRHGLGAPRSNASGGKASARPSAPAPRHALAVPPEA